MKSTPTYERVYRILEEATQTPPPDIFPHYVVFNVLRLSEHANTERFDQFFDPKYSDSLHQQRATEFCLSLCSGPLSSKDAADHFHCLERVFSTVFEFLVKKERIDMEALTRQAVELLERLLQDDQPYREPDAVEICRDLHASYFTPSADQRTPENLVVARAVDRMTISAALLVLMEPEDKNLWFGLALADYLGLLRDLLRSAISMTPKANGSSRAQLLLLRTFLWNLWHRCSTLCTWSKSSYSRSRNHSFIANSNMDLLEFLRPTIAADTIPRSPGIGELPACICPWAFEMMRSDPEAAALNTTYFLSIYGKYFGHFPARCIPRSDGSFQQCPGQGPTDCRRFTGAYIEDQNAHRATCNRACERLFWNEASYRRVQGPRAVSLNDAADGLLTYCAASTSTMTISHVWSHGQGGRPERPRPEQSSTGFNRCLHQRYCQIARAAGCDSYWIDTACIPQDHSLRREAISDINSIFAKSRLMLICDRDLMNIDISRKNLPVMESVLVALLVCDWNVRAWTLLEGVKGSRNPHILCKDDHIISLSEVITEVHKGSRLSLGGLCLTIHHLLHDESRDQRYGRPYLDWSFLGYGEYGIEDSAGLLDHRHASRPGDELVIWSLLSGKVAYTPREFWSREKGVRYVKTAFLISDAPRMRGVPGRSWAPIRADLAPVGIHGAGEGKVDQDKTIIHSTANARRFANQGSRSWDGLITEHGLTANWLICRVADSRWSSLMSCLAQIVLCFRATAKTPFYRLWIGQYYRNMSYYWQMVFAPQILRRRFQTIAAECGIANIQRMALLQACSKSQSTPLPYRSVDGKSTALVVIEATNESKTSWVWHKVIDWTDLVPLPPFLVSEILIE